MKKIVAMTVILAVIAGLFSGFAYAASVSIVGISLTEAVTLAKGETALLDLVCETEREAAPVDVAEAAAKLDFVWESSNEAVVTVDESGIITAINGGDADITVRSGKDEALQAVCHVTVVVELESIVTPGSIMLVRNGADNISLAMSTQLIPANATVPTGISYTSSDESVATVDATGNVQAIGNGSCVIITDAGNGIAAMTIVTVETAPVDISAEDITLTIGESGTIITEFVGEDITINPEIGYISGNENVVVVDADGNVQAVGVGNAEISVIAYINGQNLYGHCNVVVKNIVCGYCGAEGHTAGSCAVKAADEAAAAERAAQAAAQRAAEQAAAQAATSLTEPATPAAGPAPASPAPSGIPQNSGCGVMCP